MNEEKAKKNKILIIDDNVEIRSIYADNFQQAGFEVLEGNDGVEGLDLATKELPDIIFSGIIMPRMDGFMMMEALKKNISTANIPVVISSHMGREEDRKRAEELGAKDFIVNAVISPKEAVEKIKKLISFNEYSIKLDPHNPEVSKLAVDLGISPDLKCPKCGGDLVLKMALENKKEKILRAKVACSRCGA